MTSRRIAALAAAAIAMPLGPALAFTGVGGCNSLPEYYRALGALQGGMESACNMSVEEARRIVAAYDGPAAVYPQTKRAPRLHRRRRVAGS